MHWAGIRIAIILPAALLAGCLAIPPVGVAPTVVDTPTLPPAAARQPATTAPTDTTANSGAADNGPLVLTVWMPDSIYLSSDSPGGQVLLDQISAFDDQHADIRTQIVVKRLRGPGGILSYLHTAVAVAPSILPDVTLMDQDALTDAARARLVASLKNLLDPAVLAELYPAAREVGSVDGDQVGLPYLLEIDHSVYRSSVFRRPPETYQQVLDSGQLFAFPAGASGGVSTVILAQYMAAGGTLVDAGGSSVLDAPSLTDVLSFYAQAKTRGDMSPALFQLTDDAAVWGFYQERQTNLAAITSSRYLAEQGQVSGSRTGALPTADGKLYALARGWSWVVVTRDPVRQAAAMALLNFLISPVNQSKYSEEAHWLPSQPAALALWVGQDQSYLGLAAGLLGSAQAMPDPAVRAVVGMPLQDALEAVVLNGMAPAQAASQAVNSVKSSHPPSP